MVFQSFALFPWLDVLDNVEIGPRANGVPLDETRKRALKAIDTIGLDGFEIRLPEGTFGRHAPARRLRPGSRHAAEDPADGRAVLGARRAHRRNLAHRPARSLAGRAHTDQSHPDGHPQYRGGGADGRPHSRAVVQSRPHRLRDPGHPSPSARSAGPRFPRPGRQDLRADDPTAGPDETGDARSRDGGRPWARAAARLDQFARRHARGDRRAALRRKGGPAASRRTRCSSKSTTCSRSAKPCNCCAWRSSRTPTSS